MQKKYNLSHKQIRSSKRFLCLATSQKKIIFYIFLIKLCACFLFKLVYNNKNYLYLDEAISFVANSTAHDQLVEFLYKKNVFLVDIDKLIIINKQDLNKNFSFSINDLPSDSILSLGIFSSDVKYVLAQVTIYM